MDYLSDVTNKRLRGEFVRALQTIDTMQLTTFRESPATPRADILQSFKAKFDQRINQGETGGDELQVSIMRDMLGEILESYNDPYANYVNPESLKRYYQRRKGNFVGIGVKFRSRKGRYPVVIGALTGGPLANANVKPGDRILSIEGKDQLDASATDVSGALKGEQGSEVNLVLGRAVPNAESDAMTEISLVATRQPVKLEYVRSEIVEGNIGYLKVSRFGANSHKALSLQIQQLLAQKVRGFVLDLRDNSGGSTRAARAMVSMFSDAEWIYCEQMQSGNTRELPRHGERLTDLPLVVLINEKSMSSSEIVAGAFKAEGSATIVGAPTYGKGLIQRVFNLKAPLGGAVRTTIAAYATPDHVLIHGLGVVPDIFVESAPHFLFRETGSLNISDDARRYKRSLLEEDLDEKHPDKADHLKTLEDLQLKVALKQFD